MTERGPQSLTKKLFSSGSAALLIKVASAGTSYIMLVAFARLLSAEEFGRFGLMLNMAIFLAALLSLGLPTAIMRIWPTYVEKQQFSEARGIVAGSLKLLWIASFVLLVGASVLTFLGWQTQKFGFPDAWLAIAILGATFAFGDYFSSALRAQGAVIWALAPRDILWRLASPLLALLILWQVGNSDARVATYCCVSVMILVFVAQYIQHFRLTRRIAGTGDTAMQWSTWRKLLVPLWGSGVLFALVQQADVIVVGALLSSAETGAYFAAQKTASLLGLVMIAGGLVAAPMMAASYHSGRMVELQNICRLLAVAIAISTLVGFAFLVLAGSALLAFFDPQYANAYWVLMVLAFGFAIDAMAGPSAYLMQMTKLEWAYLRIMAVVYLLVLLLQLIFVPRYGILAAAIATASGVIIWNALAVTLLRREIKIDPSVFSIFRKSRN